jgi:hypothetical protein
MHQLENHTRQVTLQKDLVQNCSKVANKLPLHLQQLLLLLRLLDLLLLFLPPLLLRALLCLEKKHSWSRFKKLARFGYADRRSNSISHHLGRKIIVAR